MSKKHVCEDWVDEGRGCSMCGNVLRYVKKEDLKEAAEFVAWRTKEQRMEIAKLKEEVKSLRKLINVKKPL